ncbi:hypothetical protein FRC10_004811 [Ceratobasidium sp. 414]|nr:hypothetical protein FRC10_004811 [Ceratobasidium sp. 414]
MGNTPGASPSISFPGPGAGWKEYPREPFSGDNTPPTLAQSLGDPSSIVSSAACLTGESRTSPGVAYAEPPNLSRCESPSPVPSVSDLQPASKPSRKILIIGSDYDRAERRTASVLSVVTLASPSRDAEDLRDAFRQRGYSAHSLVNSRFTREEVLQRVADFFLDAKSGDVRAVVFTGHAYCEDNGPVMLIPPQCSGAEEAISEKDWEENIRKHAKPGVVAFSILAHSLGDFMTQKLDLSQWHDVVQRCHLSSVEVEPIFVTFSASLGDMLAYESALAADSLRVTDHFIHALLSTIHNTEVHDWGSFFRVFEGEFQATRAAASQTDLDKPVGRTWRDDNPQIPCFSTSRAIEVHSTTLDMSEILYTILNGCLWGTFNTSCQLFDPEFQLELNNLYKDALGSGKKSGIDYFQEGISQHHWGAPIPASRLTLNPPRPTTARTSLLIFMSSMGKVGDRLKRGFQHLSRSVTPQPPPDPAWAGLKSFVQVLGASADVFGPLRQAIDAFAGFIGVYETVVEVREEYKTLRIELDGLFHDLADGFGGSVPPGMRPSIVNLARGIEQEISFFRQMKRKNTLSRYAEASEDVDQVLYRCRRIRALLERLTLNANIKIWMLVDEQATSQRLDRLSPSHEAWYRSAESEKIYRDECTPDTRVEVLERFRAWQGNSDSEKVYWLNGMAGTGKTTLAYTLCRQLEDDNKLAGNFFCTRQLPSCRDAKFILPTIAYQLANFSYPFRYALSQILDQNRDVHTRRISEQFEKLLYKPLHEVQFSLPYNLVVVIDGLDECQNDHGVGEILDALFDHVSDMPIKFFLTSRPEPAIRSRMLQRKGDRDRFELHLHELDKGVVREDVRKYLQASLKHPNLTLSGAHLEILTERSGVLFIYAATVVRYVSAYNFLRSDDRLKDVLEATTGSNGSDQDMSSLYNLILKRAFEDPRLIAREQEEMRLLLETVICAREPLTVRAMASVLGLKGERSVDAALSLLRSVLNVQKDQTITTLHKSFSDHMLAPARSLDFCCDPKKHNGWLARRCFDLMGDICIHSFDEDGPDPPLIPDGTLDLNQEIEQQVSGPLIYACRHWATHLRLAERPWDILNGLRYFLLIRLLLSMEVVNLTMLMQHRVETPPQANMPEWRQRTGWDLVAEAVAVAISLKQYDLALEWFEQGRSILWGQTLQLQTPYDDLDIGNPEMLKPLQRALHQPKYPAMAEPAEGPSAHDEGSFDGNSWKRHLAETRRELFKFARFLPGLEESLRPLKASTLASLVQDGTVVIVNTDGSRCDALVIQAGAQEITHVPLIEFSVQKAERACAELVLGPKTGESRGRATPAIRLRRTYEGVLARLWCDVAKPVLDHLGIAQVSPVDDLPHVTWCTTCPLSFLPLHAAGNYEDPNTVLPNLAISSYTPMLSLLSQRTPFPGTFSGILGVGHTPSTSGLGASSGAVAELEGLQRQAKPLPFTRLDENNACADIVLKAMANHSWVHFACHISQNVLDPMKYVLQLYKGDLDLATIAQDPIKNAQLAYLSSCGAAVGNSGSPDGPAPLAAGLLMAGYQTVIATMWAVGDTDASSVAGKVYECLLEGGVPNSRKAAKALHGAVALLREEVGVDKFERWVPYVHVGC